MTLAVLENTRPGSYKGVPFLVEEHSAKEGRNNATFLYIGSNRRAYKDLGGYPGDGKLSVITHGVDGGYFARRDALRRVLNESTAGKLVHPFLGNLFIKPGQFTYKETFAEIGVCRFEIPYSIVDEDAGNPLVPTYSLSNPAKVKQFALAANRALQAASADAFSATTNINKECGKSKFRTALEALKSKMAGLGDTLSKVNNYAGKALAAIEQAAFYANNPLVGFAAIADGLLGVDGLTVDLFAKFKTFEAMFTFGDSGDEFSTAITSPFRVNEIPQTLEDAERTNNDAIMNTFMQAGATIEAMANLGKATFTSVEEINLYASKIAAQTAKIEQAMTGNDTNQVFRFPVKRPDYLAADAAMKDLNQSLTEYFESQKLLVPRIETINVQPQPASVLAYMLYGDSTRAEEIMDLNNLKDNFRVSGDIKVLSI